MPGHGIIRGIKRPDIHGDRRGLVLANGMSGVTQDATSGIYVPSSSTEWTTTLAAAGIASGGPSLLWLLQEASGNVADSIGSFTGTVSSLPTYQTVITGWSRKGISYTDGAGGGGIATTSASLADPTTASGLLLSYTTVTGTPAIARNVQMVGATNRLFAQVNTTPALAAILSGTTTGVTNPVGSVRPYVNQWNINTSTAVVATNQETLTPGWIGPSGKRVSLGSVSSPPAVTYTYAVFFSGAAAELTTAQLRTLLQTLGWTIAW